MSKPDDTISLPIATTSSSKPYTHNFTLPQPKPLLRLKNAVLRPFRMHEAGFGWVFTRRQFYRKLKKIMYEKER